MDGTHQLMSASEDIIALADAAKTRKISPLIFARIFSKPEFRIMSPEDFKVVSVEKLNHNYYQIIVQQAVIDTNTKLY